MSKITQEELLTLIENEEYARFGKTCTVCALTVKSGYTVIGKSGCIDPAQFDETIGRKLAFDNAVNELWALHGYHVSNTIHQSNEVQNG